MNRMPRRAIRRPVPDRNAEAIAAWGAVGADNLKERIARRLSGKALGSLAAEAA